jgi:Mitochondrial carrier protein.
MNPEKKKGNFSLFCEDLICAGGATAISRTAVAPLERIRIILQAQKVTSLTEKDRFSGFFDALVSTHSI